SRERGTSFTGCPRPLYYARCSRPFEYRAATIGVNMRGESKPRLIPVRQACKVLGVSYPALKQWIYKGKIKTVKTPGGHHRIPETEIDRLLPAVPQRGPVQKRRENFRKISGRNQLVGRIIELKIEGLMAQVTLSFGGQYLTAIITADAAREMRLEKGQLAAALIKSTEVMVIRP